MPDTRFDELMRALAEPAAASGAALGDVPAADVVYGTYGIVAGQLPDGRDTQLTGYVIATHEAVANYQGWTRDACLVVTVASSPEALDGIAIAVPTGADITVISPPPGAPAGAAAPWRQMPVTDQIITALAEAGSSLHEEPDARGQARWTIPRVDRDFRDLDSIATYLFGNDTWRGRGAPLLRQSLVDQAVNEGRWDGATAMGPTPLRGVRPGAYGTITGLVDGTEQTVTGMYDRWWTPSHGTQRSAAAHVAVKVLDPDGRPNANRVVTVAVPATGAQFTVADRPPLPEPAPVTPKATIRRAAVEDTLPFEFPLAQPAPMPGAPLRADSDIARLEAPAAQTRQRERTLAPEGADREPARPGGDAAPAQHDAARDAADGERADLAPEELARSSTLAASSPSAAPVGEPVPPPTGEADRIRANLAAVRAALLADAQPATTEERDLYARWSGWGATPGLFDERPRFAARFAAERAELQQLLGEDGYRAARATTLNAHYTDPQFVTAIWAAVTQLGFAGGTVLEPGCGSGNFFAGAPAGSTLVGVEVDPTTARIAQARFPHAEIRTESFADTRLPDTGFDLVIGNVPFGSHKLHDPRHNPGRQHSIHNHFILKALHATRPDGLVAVITSRYTMDGRDDAHLAARAQMAALADLVGAVRLPSEAHAAAAGTDVVTDLLILRRRAADQPPAGSAWMQTQSVQLPAAQAAGPTDAFDVNEYFLDRPAMVLGQQLTHSGRHRPVLVVQADTAAVGGALTGALDRIVAAATEPPEPPAPPRAPTPDQEGLFIDAGDGRFFQVRDGRRARHEPASTQVAELQALIGLRETILALLDEEAAHRADTPQTRQLRADLNRRYDAYVAAHGPINRFQRATGTKVDKKTGDVVESERRTYPRMGSFRDDPFFPYVAALERFDDDSGTADKAEVFTQRVITVPTPVDHVDSADDALVVCWDRHNEVRLDVIASLLGLDTEAQARDALAGRVFDEPGTGRLIRKAEYLSGNVRSKLDAAQTAAASDPQFQTNVTALQEVIPRDLTPGEISARLGAPWISAGHVQQFLQEILEDPGVRVANIGASWSVTGGAKNGVLATTVWGTRNRPATDLAASLLNSQTIEITKTIGTGKEARTVRDSEATAFAQAKSQQLDDRFRTWLWEDPDRAAALGRTYNDRFNARVVRNYEGEHITAPGMSAAFTLRPHQMAAVARIRNTRGTGLFHGTGAGKTLEMIVGGMELVRLGLVSKPAYVVPKGVLGQFRREFLQAYPRAKVLAADSEDLEGDKRRQFVARCSTGTWDAIIISHNAFKKIPVSREVKVAYLNKQLDRLKKHLENTEGADRYTVKDVEKQVATLQEQIKEQLETPSDPGVEFERTGIGYLFIDEAHVYKNLRVISAIPELAHPGNQITADLEMKLEYLRRTSPRVVTLATATPIDNSPSEILTMTKYAAPELLVEMGIEEDDQYHAAFIQPRRRIEMRADGSGFTSKTRHSRFVNLPEQKQLMYSWADVKLKEHLDLGEPAIIGGQPEILSVPASTELRQHLVSLAARARAVTSGSPEPRLTTKGVLRDDNILWISTDGRTASLDLRLMGAGTAEPQKLDVAADWLSASWNAHKDDVYYRPDGTPDPERGSLHLVFCDLGVPRDGRWNIYDGLRDALVARGMPADKIRFAQDATSRRQKDQLDQDARDGKIAVLIGSRAGLGTGRNIQRRVISIMQLDPTWKLSPVVQSLGRGQRQGNANPAIHHVFVVTENSYDPFLWQKVDDKARFTKQMLDPNDTTRIIDAQEDDTDGQIDPAVMFAVAAGRPELLELHRIEETVGALRLEQRIWGDEQVTLKVTVEQNRRTIAGLHRTIGELDEVLARRVDTRGDAFRMTLDGVTFDTRADAGAALVGRLHPAVHTAYGRTQLHLGQLGGIALHASIEPDLLGHRALLRLEGISDSTVELTQRDLDTLAAGEGQDRVGLIRKLENGLTGADDLRAGQVEAVDRLQANIDRATDRIGLPFPGQTELAKHTAKLTALHKQLRIIDVAVSDVTATPDTAPSDPAGPDTASTSYAAEGQLLPRRTDANDVAAVDEPAHAVAATTPRPSDSAAASAGGRGPVAVASDTRNGGSETQSRHDTSPIQQPPAAAGLPELHRRRRGHPFYPPADITAAVPGLHATDAQPAEDKVLHLHYFGGAFDAWLAEYDPATGTGYGFVNLGDPSDAEWTYVDLPELEAINRGLLIIERDLHWTPVRAADANLPGPRAPRPAAASTAETVPATTLTTPDADSTATDPEKRSTAVAGPDVTPATTTPNRSVTAPSALPPAMTPSQQAAIAELGNERGEPWSIRREWRMRTFAEVSADDLAGLTAADRQALTADVQESLTSPAWRERATARRLLDRWSGHPATHTEAQAAAIAVLCLPASSYDIPDAGRLSHYGRLTVEEYLTLDPAYQDDLKADLKAIAASGATKTIPRNRTSTGATIRGVAADHVVAADNLLRRMASGLEVAPYRSNDGNVGRTVVGLRLNPGDQVQLRSGTVTVDRVGINLTVYLVGDGTLPDSTRRYSLVAAGPAPVTGDALADRGAPPTTVTRAPSPDGAPRAPGTSPPAAPADPATPKPTLHDGQRGGGRTVAAADTDQLPLLSAVPPVLDPDTVATANVSNTAADTVEQRLMRKVTARVPDDVVQWTGTADGHPSVLLAFVANGTYGQVTGVDLQRQPITASGYVIEAGGLRGGYGGWHPDTVMFVTLGDLPDGPVVHTVQTDMQARLTVLDPPRPDLPAGEAAPWLRMPVEEQILTARTALGLTVEVRDGPANELWTVQGCPEQLTGEVAWWLFGGQYGSWVGRPRPVFRPELVQEAVTAGRIPPERQPVQPSPSLRPAWLTGVAIGEETPTADGQHHVRRRTNRHETAVYVDARHPQVGMLPRGRITVAPDHVHNDGPVTTWQLVDHDGTEIGEHTGLYAEAEARLLAATAELDEPLGDQDLAELAEEADAQQPEQDSKPGEARNADSAATAAPAAIIEAAAGPPTNPPALTGVTSAPPFPTPNIGTTAAGNDSLPEVPPSWSSRIQVIDGPALIVRGTDGSRREDGLRGLLKQHRFRWQGANSEWRYTGRPAERAAALGDIRRWLAAQDRADASRAHQPTAAMAPTGQQQLIIDAYQAGQTIAVQALAGTGKTSTLLMLANARPRARIAYIAFNAAIAAEAARKFPRHVRAGTAHSFAREALGNSPLRDKVGRVRSGARWPDEWAAHLNIEGHVGPDVVEPERVARMVMATIRVFRESAADTIGARHLPTGTAEETPELARVVLDHARTAWADIIHPDGKLFFDHDDYLKVWALTHPAMPYDTIFFDEAQDINDVLRQVIQEQPAQTIVVGDSNQSIYGFRGAIDALKQWPADTTLPLTLSWRFGPAVADVGNQFLELLDSRWRLTGNPSLDSSIGVVEEPDAVLARTNAGAVAAVVDAVDAGRRVALLGGGKMIEDIAKAALDLQAGRATKHPDLSRFATWDEVRAYVEDGEADAQSLRAFVNLVDRRGADALLQLVRELVNDSETTPDGKPAYDLIVSTVHKSKGREWGQVRIASDFPQPQTNQQTGQTVLPNDEQLRLAYVAVTRAKQRLELGSLAWIDDVAGQQPAAAVRVRAAARVAQPQLATFALAPESAAATQRREPIADPSAPLTSAAQQPAPGGDVTMPADIASAGPDRSDPPVVSHYTTPTERRDGTELDDPMQRFTALEQATIRTAVADYAGFYFLGVLNPGRESAARYVSEGHLQDLADRHGLAAVWDAVTAVIDADPSVLERTETQRADLRAHRQDRAEHIAADALAAFQAGDYSLAQELVTKGELLDPTFRPGRTEQKPYGTGWHQMTEAITHRRNNPVPAQLSQPGEPDGPDKPPQHRTAAQLARLDTAVALGTAASRPSDPRAVHARTETANGNRTAVGL